MPSRSKFNAVVIFILTALFYFFFMTTKHNAALLIVNAFADDPYDAIGSFGVQVSIFLSILSLFRVFRRAPSTEEKIFAVRTQMAAILAVAVTLAGDIVAMTRYLSMWIGTSAGNELAALVGGMLFLVILAAWLVLRAGKEITSQPVRVSWTRTVTISLLFIAVAGFYPRSWSQETVGGLLTVIVGVLLLFAPIRAWGAALMPYDVHAPDQTAPHQSKQKYYWGFTILLGVLMGIFFVLGERSEGGGSRPPIPVVLMVGSVYIGLETAGLLIGYGFLGKYLGLFRQIS